MTQKEQEKLFEGYNIKIFTDNIEDSALKQLKELLSIDVFSDKKIRIMPDVHTGIGAVIGFTGDLGDKVIPSVVGVDIGCGMLVIKLGKIEEIAFHNFNTHILNSVPSGRAVRKENSLRNFFNEEIILYDEAKKIVDELYCAPFLEDKNRLYLSLGTLGGGNHFIELDKDEEKNLYLVIHTGSRNLGTQVATHYQNLAIKHMTEGAEDFEDRKNKTIEEYKSCEKENEIESMLLKMKKEQNEKKPLLPPYLCYIEGTTRSDYLHDMRLTQKWAALNRKLIALCLLRFFADKGILEKDNNENKSTWDTITFTHNNQLIQSPFFESIHNYISSDNIIRKGAISAKSGEKCIIPLNMRDGSLLCEGKGNADWNYSAPHGAGRILSRKAANEKIRMEDFKKAMEGIYSETINSSTIDESPMAYKKSSEIIQNIEPTVKINRIITPIFNFKASS